MLLGSICLIVAAPPAAPTKADIEALATRQIALLEKKIAPQNRTILNEIRRKVRLSKSSPMAFKRTVSDVVDQLTLGLVHMKSPSTVLVASSSLVLDAYNNRTLNLFGSTLHSVEKYADAAKVFRHALAASPKNQHLLLNYAVSSLDSGDMPATKSTLDQLLKLNPNCRTAWRVYAAYWFKKGDLNKTRDCQWKAAQFAGYVRKKVEKEIEAADKNTVDPQDSVPAIEKKIAVLETLKPITTAEIVDPAEPKVAQRIRDRRLRLNPSEMAKVPGLPVTGTIGHKEFNEKFPVVETWVKVFADEFEQYTLNKPEVKEIMSQGSDAAKEAKAQEVAKKQIEDAMRQAEANLKHLKDLNIPGQSANVEEALKALKEQAAKHGIKPGSGVTLVTGVPPGWDYGSPIAKINYARYVVARQAFESWFFKYFLMDYKVKEADILKHYMQELTPEQQRWAKEMERLAEEHANANGGGNHDDKDLGCMAPLRNHRLKVNEIGDRHFKQWSNLYFPQYAQKMKPMLEKYWNTSALYIKNMQRKEVMEREYNTLRDNFHNYLLQVGTSAAMGKSFIYEPPTEQEEEAFRQRVETSETDAEAKKPGFLQDYDVPQDDWVKWIGDHLELEVDLEFIGFKITPTTIEFEAFYGCAGSGIKFDMLNTVVETYSSLGPKAKIGVHIGKWGADVEARTDFIRKTCTWEFETGVYKESYTSSSELKGIVGEVSPGSKTVSGNNISAGIKYQIDAELRSKLETQISAQAGNLRLNAKEVFE